MIKLLRKWFDKRRHERYRKQDIKEALEEIAYHEKQIETYRRKKQARAAAYYFFDGTRSGHNRAIRAIDLYEEAIDQHLIRHSLVAERLRELRK
ncbi:hypothetical protein BLD48_05935 [Exiguobacterium sp. KRL4]|uniref:hypothetical protein n=1 Tax=Exiguobacterium sp. KRL4 TaxID=1914536 RepID=UPI0008F83996|nr:hypothetical protein [Exiguobacterium sp. KRL4]OIN67426.1 hypothetical protein BLD48_05935 [Exiguobacterium sp. KRL4]